MMNVQFTFTREFLPSSLLQSVRWSQPYDITIPIMEDVPFSAIQNKVQHWVGLTKMKVLTLQKDIHEFAIIYKTKLLLVFVLVQIPLKPSVSNKKIQQKQK
ncbi:hypothetical protein HRI_001050300 [Hibiscus trionum]|uniref:Uncharacterized protein n=1 Tax=Hibiscus trionum TaxID=183268 RepID=A0A9W7HDI3_HIBTR|nr:hypothetical protein HRI_001050300 [Hibiscus trionum]